MAINAVNSRVSLTNYIKRRLGSPVVELNLDADQIDDRIDDALQRFQDYQTSRLATASAFCSMKSRLGST